MNVRPFVEELTDTANRAPLALVKIKLAAKNCAAMETFVGTVFVPSVAALKKEFCAVATSGADTYQKPPLCQLVCAGRFCHEVTARFVSY